MAAWLPKNPFKSKLVEQKINRLAFLQTQDIKNLPTYSPALNQLQNGTSRVKKLSKMFEEKSKNYNAQANWWLDDDPKGSPKIRNGFFNANERTNNSPAKVLTKMDKIVNELLQKELTYIQALEKGINCYVNAVKEGDEEVPADLRHQTFKIFGNIEEIHQFHKKSVYPRLTVCNGNAKVIAETITSLIQNDLFYCYITYGINQKFAEQVFSLYYGYFENLRSNSDDMLGISSFIIQPIQKIPRYKMFLDEMIKELSSDVVSNKETIAACCVAEKNVKRFLSRLNQAISIADILETNEFGISVQTSLISTIQNSFALTINEPILLLVPKTSLNFPFRSPFNIYDLGKFIKSSTFKAQELLRSRSFPSKVFVFEKCLLYTKIINEGCLGYRNHFLFRSGFSFFTKDCQTSFRVCGVNKKHDVIFSSSNIESIAEMKRLIDQFYDPRRSDGSAFVDGNELMICEDPVNSDNVDEDWVLTDCQ